MTNRTETIVSTKEKEEANKIMDFFLELSSEEKKEILLLMQGVKLGKTLLVNSAKQ